MEATSTWLGRLLVQLHPDVVGVSAAAGVPVDELHRVIAGGPPNPATARRLAPVLGLHTADLFILADLDLPADLAPARGTPSRDVGALLFEAARLPPQSREAVHATVRSLPPRPPAPQPSERYAPGAPGALLLRLAANRNIQPYCVRALIVIGDGPYVSMATIRQLGRASAMVTPQYLSAFAHLLGIPTAVLAAATGIDPAEAPRLHPHGAELAAMAWDARRLGDDQLAAVTRLATDLRRTARCQFCPPCLDYHGPDAHG